MVPAAIPHGCHAYVRATFARRPVKAGGGEGGGLRDRAHARDPAHPRPNFQRSRDEVVRRSIAGY